jgi:FixJ family two-component response regulator
MLARIVVIEDDVYMREELIDMLKKQGMMPFLYLLLKTLYHS